MLTRGGNYQKVIMQNAVGATGNGTAVVPTDLSEGAYQLLTAQVVGITNATITWEGSLDGTNFIAINARNMNTQAIATTTTADGIFRINITGLFSIRARISAWASGTITVTALCSTVGEAGIISVGSLNAGENHLGEVGTGDDVIDVTCTLDTSAYASGDLLFDTQAATSAARVNAGKVVLESVTVLDEDDQGIAFDLYFLDANNSMGTENSAPSISDANARAILGYVPILSTDYRDLGGCRVACKAGIGLAMKAGSGTTTIYVAGVNGTGTPTFTASGLRLKLGFLRS